MTGSAADKIVDVLIDHKIDYVFGVPGGITIHLVNSFYRVKDKINVIVTRNEQTASIMANAYGRLTGKPGVLFCQGPYAGSIGLLGTLESFCGSTPMLVLTDITDYGAFSQHYPAQSGSGEPGTFDLKNILKSTCKFVSSPITAEDAVQSVQQGIKYAVSDRPGPAAVVLRSSNFSRPLNSECFPKLYPANTYLCQKKAFANGQAIKNTLEMLDIADQPLLIVGNGIHVSKSYDKLYQFAKQTNIPIATSNMGKGAIDEMSEFSIGCIGAFGHPLANHILSKADVVMILGSRMKPQDTCFENPNVIDPDRQKIIQVDCVEQNIACNFPVELGIVGEVSNVLDQLIDGLKKGFNREKQRQRLKKILSMKKEYEHFSYLVSKSEDRSISPACLVNSIRESVPKDTLVFTDAGNNRFWMARYFPAKIGSYFGPGGTLSMSYAAPAAVAGKMIFPQRPCLAVAGDGGFMMECHVLSTVFQYKVPVVFIIFNNSCLGMVTENQNEKLIGSEFTQTDFSKIARGFGIMAKKIINPDELKPSIKKAFNSGEAYLLDVEVNNSDKIYKELFVPEARNVFDAMVRTGQFFQKG